MTKKKHRALEAMRRLGAEPPPPDPNFRCRHRSFGFGDPCNGKPSKMRRDYDGTMKWFCPNHDPVRIEHERRNKKKRDEEKRDRWKQMERERKP